MLDERSLFLLKYLNGESGGGYKIFELKELLPIFPEYLETDCEGLRDCLTTLAQKEYISVKYEDEEQICLTPLSKGRLVFENIIDQEIEKIRAERKYFNYSFMGALVGSGVAGLIFGVMLTLLGVAGC